MALLYKNIESLNIKTKSSFWFIYALMISYMSFAQQTEKVDFLKVRAIIKPNLVEKSITANAAYSFKVLKKCDSIYIDAPGIVLLKSNAHDKIEVISRNKKIWMLSDFIPNETYTVSIQYEANPRKALYFLENQIWTQGQGKYTSNWLPSIDDMNDKIEFDISYIVPNSKEVVANGNLISVSNIDGLKKWDFDMDKPMSSYLVAFTVGDYSFKEDVSDSKISLEYYYPKNDSLYFEPTYRYATKIFNFIEKEIGVPYPWQNYKQVPLKDFMYAGMENTTATFFSDAFIVDSIGFIDRNYINVNAHELAHQWFGNLVTETSSTHHWLHEGFASYYALLAEKEVFGEDYFYWKLYQSAEQLKSLSDEGKGEALNNPNASSLTFYEKGAWALHILKEKVGAQVFKQAIKNYLTTYQYKNVTIDDFIFEIEKVYGNQLNEFKKNWIAQSAFQSEEAFKSLMKSSFLEEYFKISSLRSTPISLKIKELDKALNKPNDFIGQEVIYQLEGEPYTITIPLYKKAFNSNNLMVRQAIALSISKIPSELKNEYESLLNDHSYLTIESALGNLWVNFPDEKSKYLNQTKSLIGFQDKNIRQFWLFLSLITEGYNENEKENYLNELKSYTSSIFGYSIREKAFEYIGYLSLWDQETLLNLIDASQHHYWRFKNSSKKMLKKLLEEKDLRAQIILLKPKLDEASQVVIDKIIN